ncbi:MAG TPA: hypothetical protein ENJ08_08400 [Gammaproteobacteria bacterium]|nr:hypothetical protein [Gammaproteobacteria bacterium]
MPDRMNKQTEYAELYTRQERIRYAVVMSALLAALLLATYFYLFPQWTHFVATAHCKTIFNMPGLAVMVYAIFIGIPTIGGVFLELVFAWLGIKTIIEKRSPPAKTKVFKKTEVLRGRDAVLKGIFILLFVPAIFIPLISWGYLQAGEFIGQMDVERLDYSVCVKQVNNF